VTAMDLDVLDERITAEHEAAHAVVAVSLGLQVARVGLSRDVLAAKGRRAPYCDHEDGPPHAEVLIAAAGDTWVEDFTDLAAQAAEQYESADSDWDKVGRIGGYGNEGRARDGARRVLSAPGRASAIRRVADALIQHGVLAGTEVHALIDQTDQQQEAS
jgi:hypothetical protein